MDPVPQDLPPGSDSQDSPIGITEEPASTRVTASISDTPSSYTLEGSLQLCQSHQVRHSNIVQNPTNINLDEATLDSTSVEEHAVPSQFSRIIP